MTTDYLTTEVRYSNGDDPQEYREPVAEALVSFEKLLTLAINPDSDVRHVYLWNDACELQARFECHTDIFTRPQGTPIEELELSVRGYNLCKRAGFDTCEHLSKFLFVSGALALADKLTEALRASRGSKLFVKIRTLQEIAEALDYFEHRNDSEEGV